MTTDKKNDNGDVYIGNVWGWKWSYISLAIILIVMLIAVCRYIVIQPEHLIDPEQIEQF